MEQKIIVIGSAEFQKLLERLEILEVSVRSLTGFEKKDLFTEKEAGAYLNLSAKTLQNLRNSGELGFVRRKTGRRIIYKLEHLEGYLRNNEIKAFKVRKTNY